MQVASGKVLSNLPGQAAWVKKGGLRFVRRSGTSLRQPVGGWGRSVVMVSAVPQGHRLGDCEFDVHAQSADDVAREMAEHAQVPLKRNVERVRDALEERSLGVADKMAAPMFLEQETINLVSDEEFKSQK
ncbi:hypothetical protein NDU88_002450 [Pleurodeles waltl]|uniref:Uncharacterized protein n=1 Tax=Pleurodeles waltl TaxID=8319 RepID=A0AAV7LFX7_PLEWA|nr:hypothetical protein NDU88_002450 [Pleurodeles waltl]